METKVCKRCNIDKPVDQFGRRGNYFQFVCKICANEIAKLWYAEKKNDANIKSNIFQRNKKKEKYLKKLVDEIKSKLGCAICSEKDSCCLDFHHKNKNKDRNVSTWVRLKSEKKLISEIKKCICVCSNCHRKIHASKIKCPDTQFKENELKIIIEEFKKENPWIVKYERTKKPKILKNNCLQCGQKTNNLKYCSSKCRGISKRKVKRPTIEELKIKLKTMPMIKIAKMYGVTDNSVRKWLKTD
jgi:hypothetical protein